MSHTVIMDRIRDIVREFQQKSYRVFFGEINLIFPLVRWGSRGQKFKTADGNLNWLETVTKILEAFP